MARGQHTNVIEPPKRTAHNLAYLGEGLIETILFTGVFVALTLARTAPLGIFTLVTIAGMVITTTIPRVVNGRIVDFVARAQETLIESDRGEDQK